MINLCIGSLYAWSVFAGPMAEHISQVQGLTGDQQLTAAALAVVFTVANAVGPVTMIGGGFINDSLGPRWGILLGGLLFGGGMAFKRLCREPRHADGGLRSGLWSGHGLCLYLYD